LYQLLHHLKLPERVDLVVLLEVVQMKIQEAAVEVDRIVDLVAVGLVVLVVVVVQVQVQIHKIAKLAAMYQNKAQLLLIQNIHNIEIKIRKAV